MKLTLQISLSFAVSSKFVNDIYKIFNKINYLRTKDGKFNLNLYLNYSNSTLLLSSPI
jgi:hypothetical protein